MSGAPVLLAQPTADERSGSDRRAGDRRAPRRSIDPLFAATLVNHVTPAETIVANGYAAARGPRAGIAINVRA